MTTTLAEAGLSSKTRKKIKRLQLFTFGTFKTGKTIIAHSMPRTRTLDFDDGMQSVEWAIKKGIIKKELSDVPYRTMLPEKRTDKDFLNGALEQVNEWLREEDVDPKKWDKPYPQQWDTLVVDSMTGFNAGVMVLALAENGRLELSKSWEKWNPKKIGSLTLLQTMPSRIQDYGAAANLTLQFITELKLLPKNIVITAHEYNNSDDEGNTISVQPLLWGQARQTVPSAFDEVWYCETSGTRQAPVFQFQTAPGNKKNCGSRLGCLDPVEKGDFSAIKKKIAKFYGVKEDWLWSAEHGMEAAERAAAEALEEEGTRI